MVAIDGLLDPEAGETLLAALDRWPAPPTPTTSAAHPSVALMPWPSSPAAPWKPAACPDRGVRPQLLVTVDLDSLLRPGGLDGEIGGTDALDPEACRRLACEGR